MKISNKQNIEFLQDLTEAKGNWDFRISDLFKNPDRTDI